MCASVVGPGNTVRDAVARALRASGAQTASSFPGQAATAQAQAPAPAPNTDFLALGLTCAALGDLAGAEAALRQALARSPDGTQAQAALRRVLAPAGLDDDDWQDDPAQGATGAGSVAGAAGLEAAERQWQARLRGDAPGMAELALRDHLQRAPGDAAALRVLADFVAKDGRETEAARMLARALHIAPFYAAARHAYAALLFRMGRDVLALAQTRRLLAQDPNRPAYRILLGSCLAKTGDFDGAIAAYEGVLPHAASYADLWLSYAQALKAAGRRDDSELAFRRVLALSPGHGDAYWGLQNLTSAPAPAPEMAAMRAHLGRAATTVSRFALHYALGHALEKSREYAESFAQYEVGARLKRATLGYRAEIAAARVDRTLDVLSADFLSARAGLGCGDPAPIFILGMPRAGSTLIEQILASHSAVEGTHELPEIPRMVEEIGGEARYPEVLRSLDGLAWASLGARYLSRCRAYRRTGRPLFIDKMPGNWVETGLIHLMLPQARIIDARRGAMATCFGAFKKVFAVGQDFSYDLNDLGRFYADYVRLMAHMDTSLPGRVHRVQYEDLVADTEGETRRLLAYCGLKFEPACLRFWDSGRAVSTASAQQVRQPIYREALEQWRHYEPFLGPLADALGAAGAREAKGSQGKPREKGWVE